MAILDIVLYPANILKEKAEPITEINNEIKILAQNMLETMYEFKGIGLAANQVNILKRIIVIDLQENEINNPKVLINPEIIEHSENIVKSEEGCLSIPDPTETIDRYETISVKYQNINNQTHTIKADGLLARCLQHEVDHLNGVLFIDHLSPLKKKLLISKFKKNLKRK